MATTIKNFISTDSLQYEKHIATIKFQNFQNIRHLKHIIADQFSDNPALSNARCRCIEYYKYPRSLPKHHTWLEIQNSITIFRDYIFGFSKFLSTFNFFLHTALLA